MKVFFVSFLLALSITTTSTHAAMTTQESPSVQFQSAKRVSFKSGSCPPPKRSALTKRRGIYTFTLEHGDVGTCSTDANARNTSTAGVPYMERTEISGANFAQGKRYLFSARVHFDPDFASSHKTTFFQVHQWNTGKCECGPYVMIQIHKDGGIYAWALKSHMKLQPYRLGRWTRSDFENGWIEVAVDIDTSSNSQVSIYVGGQRELTTSVFVQPQGNVFPKTGLYRHGSSSTVLPTDRVHVKDVLYSVLK